MRFAWWCDKVEFLHNLLMLLQNFSLALQVNLVEVTYIAHLNVDAIEHVQELLVIFLHEGASLQLTDLILDLDQLDLKEHECRVHLLPVEPEE